MIPCDKFCFASTSTPHHACRCPSVLFETARIPRAAPANVSGGRVGTPPPLPVHEQTTKRKRRNTTRPFGDRGPLGHCKMIPATSAPPLLRRGWAGFTKRLMLTEPNKVLNSADRCGTRASQCGTHPSQTTHRKQAHHSAGHPSHTTHSVLYASPGRTSHMSTSVD